MREIGNPTAACAELVQSSIRPQFEMLLSILRELLPEENDDEKLRLTAFSIVGQCLFYHFADPVIRNLLNDEEYAALVFEKLADHITAFSLAALKQRAQGATAGLPSSDESSREAGRKSTANKLAVAPSKKARR
jgi:hypothetical protein